MFEFLEVSRPTPVGGVAIVPIQVTPSLGVWMHELRDAR
jgi:hypothetical protein